MWSASLMTSHLVHEGRTRPRIASAWMCVAILHQTRGMTNLLESKPVGTFTVAGATRQERGRVADTATVRRGRHRRVGWFGRARQGISRTVREWHAYRHRHG
jgi:hypothetical protein